MTQLEELIQQEQSKSIYKLDDLSAELNDAESYLTRYSDNEVDVLALVVGNLIDINRRLIEQLKEVVSQD